MALGVSAACGAAGLAAHMGGHGDLDLALGTYLRPLPARAAFLPILATPTGELTIPGHTVAPGDARALMMPCQKPLPKSAATDPDRGRNP